ncbi:MAG: PilZ domain-containing protein [Novosphingobium sp.]
MAFQATFGRRSERASALLQLHMSAKLNLAHSTCPGTLETLCASGATLRLGQAPKIGSNGYLGFADMSLYCSVAWTDGERVGVLFDRILPQRQMIQLEWIASNHAAYDRRELSSEARTWR